MFCSMLLNWWIPSLSLLHAPNDVLLPNQNHRSLFLWWFLVELVGRRCWKCGNDCEAQCCVWDPVFFNKLNRKWRLSTHPKGLISTFKRMSQFCGSGYFLTLWSQESLFSNWIANLEIVISSIMGFLYYHDHLGPDVFLVLLDFNWLHISNMAHVNLPQALII